MGKGNLIAIKKAICKEVSCSGIVRSRGLCNKHYLRQKRYGRTSLVRREKGSGTRTSHGYTTVACVYQHRIEAEKALGKPLPSEAQVHHIDGNKRNNAAANLVICQDAAYHQLLHLRQTAIEQTGNPDNRKCGRCGKYDNPNSMLCYPSHSKAGVRYRHRMRAGLCVRTPLYELRPVSQGAKQQKEGD
jgi:hypothetical protein